MKAIGIDIGTTSICGVLIDAETGSVIKSTAKNSNSFLSGCAPWEKAQSVDKIISAASEILESFIDKSVAAIGVTGQMHGILYTDLKGNAVSPLYTWQDGRGNLPYNGTTYAKHLGSFSGYGNITDFYNRQNSIRPNSAAYHCTIQDYFVMQLCALNKPIMHSSNAASLGCYNLKQNKFDYPYDGEITTEYAVAGTYKNIPVSVAIGDNQASVFSTLKNETDVLVNVGTGSQISTVSSRPAASPDIETRPYFENKYLLVGAALCGGRAYSALKDLYSEIINYAAKADSDEVYGIMDKMLLNVTSSSLRADTRFAGTRLSEEICGSITGITTENLTAANLTNAVLCGMADELLNMYRQMETKSSGVVGSGNGIRKNAALIRIFEEKLNSKMKIPAHLEEASFGAALFALISCKAFKNAAEAQKLIKYI